MKKYWPTIKLCLSRGYVGILFLLIIGNTYVGENVKACLFLALFLIITLERGFEQGIDKIATAIRTQRNYHIIGDGNDIHLQGASLYADSVNVRDKTQNGIKEQ